MEEFHVILSGKVQGVGFRVKVKKIADLLGLCGWIRNLSDGSVEMDVQGSSEKLDSLFMQIKQHFGTHIQSIDREKRLPTTLYTEFKILAT